jgi:hypothetical protein
MEIGLALRLPTKMVWQSGLQCALRLVHDQARIPLVSVAFPVRFRCI